MCSMATIHGIIAFLKPDLFFEICDNDFSMAADMLKGQS
jgi:hypothetical protein